MNDLAPSTGPSNCFLNDRGLLWVPQGPRDTAGLYQACLVLGEGASCHDPLAPIHVLPNLKDTGCYNCSHFRKNSLMLGFKPLF